ncbi:MAG: hypothetical protein ACMUIG_01985 [Thermoplasmatota archaeon]
METNSFKVSAELLQRNAAKSSIRDLNAEFQRMGGKVIHKASKKGPVFQLSHQDEEYLEKFRVRLFKELGLMEEKDVPEELKEKAAPPPRYGDHHKLRRGWNVRSPKEFKEGIYDRDDRPVIEGDERPVPSRDRRPAPDDSRNMERGRKPGFPRKPDFKPREEAVKPPAPIPEDQPAREEPKLTAEDESLVKLVGSALENGAVDDGDIIRYAYESKLPENSIKRLKKLLWSNKCKGVREECPYHKKKFRFEDLMKACYGKVDGWENLQSPFIKYLDLWSGNIEKMYGEFRDQKVEVVGKISSYKPVFRKDHEHLKMLIYDTDVKTQGSDDEPKRTRKLWIRIGMDEFHRLVGDGMLRVDDIIRFRGTCIFDTFFFDYWVIDLTGIEVVRESQGEIISAPMP